jgi:hypothetical protein
MGIGPFQWFQPFHRFAPFKGGALFKVQGSMVQGQSRTRRGTVHVSGILETSKEAIYFAKPRGGVIGWLQCDPPELYAQQLGGAALRNSGVETWQISRFKRLRDPGVIVAIIPD